MQPIPAQAIINSSVAHYYNMRPALGLPDQMDVTCVTVTTLRHV